MYFNRSSSRLLQIPAWISLAIAIVLLGLPPAGLAQDVGSIKGVITDKETGEALIGANVTIKGTKLGAATDLDGAYLISNVPAGNHTLVVSYVGYRTETAPLNVTANQQAAKDFSLHVDAFLIEEVVVTGIASRTSKEVAEVAVSRVSAADYTAANNYQSVSQLVTGKIAGVNLAPTSGNVGSGFRFNVRSGGGLNGDEQPIIYVDGVRVDNTEFGADENVTGGFSVGGQGVSTLSNFNPDDIEKLEVLKGPAGAASYGTSGSNGVILITTKRGKLAPGEKRAIAFDYSATSGWNKQSFEYDKANFLSAADANRIFRTGSITQHNLSASGGSPTIRYFTSFDRRDEEGHMRNNDLNRTNLRANIDVFPNERLSLRVNAGYSLNKILRPNNDNNILGYLGNVLLFPTSYAFTDSTAVENFRDEINSNRFIGSVNAEYTPFKNLVGSVTVGVDDGNIRQDVSYPLNFDYSGVSQFDQGTRQVWNRRSAQFTYSLNARYTYNLFSNLTVNSMVGTQLFNRRRTETFIDKYNFSTELITNIGAGSELSATDETFLHRREAGIFTEHAFALADQYYLTLGMRRDYASVVGRKAPTINYPKASLALRLDKYGFFPSMFNLMKLRVAYGETGILPGLLDGIPLLYTAEPSGHGPGAVLATIGNDAIRPERVKELELGFEAELWNKYAVEFTYYRQRIKDSIIDFGNSPSTGKTATAVPFNIGEARGSGVEVLLQASPLRRRNYELGLSLIGNYQTNEVTDLGGAQPIFDGIDINVIKEGLAKHEFFAQKVLGASFNDAGVYTGPLLSDERIPLGNPVPEFTGSFSLNFRFLKNFNLYALADWAGGFSLFNQTNLFAYRFGNSPEFNRLATQLGLAGTTNIGTVAFFVEPVAGVEGLTPGTAEYVAAAERFAKLDWNWDSNFIEEADFLKLREVSLTYNFKDLLPGLFGNSYVQNIVLGFSARNLFTTTKYSGADVEVNYDGARSLSRGIDFLTLQNPRAYNFIFRVSF